MNNRKLCKLGEDMKSSISEVILDSKLALFHSFENKRLLNDFLETTKNASKKLSNTETSQTPQTTIKQTISIG